MFFREQKVLVTGASGLVGSRLIRRLVEAGALVRAVLHRHKPLQWETGVEYVPCDLTREKNCRRVVGDVRYVFHCAANTSGAMTTARTPLVHVTPNVVMNTHLLQACYDAGVQKFLWLSSTTGYPAVAYPVTEDEMFTGEPFEKYYCAGWMKRFTEVLCRMYGEKLDPPMTTLVLRPTNIYGPHDKFDVQRSHVTAALIRKVVERQDPVEVWGTGDDIRDLVYVDDCVEAMLRAMERLNKHSAINVGLGKGYSVKDVLRTILEIEDWPRARVVFNPSKPTMIPVRLVNTSRAEKLLDFRAAVDLREGLERTIAWYRASRAEQREELLQAS